MSSKIVVIVSIFFIILSDFSVQVLSVVEACGVDENDACNDKKKALPLKIIALVSILVTSMIGVCLPLATRPVSSARFRP